MKNGIDISMLFILKKKLVLVSVCYLFYRVGIRMGKVKCFKISEDWLESVQGESF